MVIFPFSCIVSATKDSEPGITVTYFEGWFDIAQIFMEKKLVWLYFYSPKRFVSFNASLALLFAFFVVVVQGETEYI